MSKRHVLTTAGLAAVGLLSLAAPAGAHVTPSPNTAPAGGYTKFDLRVGHGCGEGNTNKVEVQIPEGINTVTPQVVTGWTITRTLEQLDPPVTDAHGNEATERTSVITWTGGPLANDQLEEFGLSVRLPDEPGTLAFPTVQSCDNGESTAWIELAEDGGEEPEHPAPLFTVTEFEGGGHGAATDDEPAEGDEVAADPVAASDDDSDSATPLAIAGLVVGAAGLAVGGTALGKSRKAG